MGCCGSRGEGPYPEAGIDLDGPDSAWLAGYADPTPPARIRFEGGRSHTGTHRPELPVDGEHILREHRLKPFAAEATTVTNARFAAFVKETGYRTEAERFGWGMVFRYLLDDPHALPVSTGAPPWWAIVDGACWYQPEGPGSQIEDRRDHPVVHLGWADARAFADWAGGRLPTEAEWEHAARGGRTGDPRFPWGEQEPDDTTFLPANIFQGRFPDANSLADGWRSTAPVTAFAPNDAGLYQMIGNIWEWTGDAFQIRSASRAAKLRNDRARQMKEKVLKGGSFLCHNSYCYRYRIAARSALAADSGASNNGLRVFYDA